MKTWWCNLLYQGERWIIFPIKAISLQSSDGKKPKRGLFLKALFWGLIFLKVIERSATGKPYSTCVHGQMYQPLHQVIIKTLCLSILDLYKRPWQWGNCFSHRRTETTGHFCLCIQQGPEKQGLIWTWSKLILCLS